MNHLIVYSHPNSESFNHAICEFFKEALIEQGHEVKVRDLYAMNFNTVLGADDLAMAQSKRYADDVVAEQEFVRWADVLTMICPIWWGGLTANLRGYIDRVFSLGFAYDFGANGLEKLLTGKKLVLINTMGAPYEVYEKTGMLKSINQTLDECMADFTGIEPVAHKYFGSVVTCSQEERLAMLKEVEELATQFC